MLIILTSFIESTGQMLLYLFIYALLFFVGIFIIYKLFSWIKKCFTGSSGNSSYTPSSSSTRHYEQNNTVRSTTNTTRTVNNQTSKTNNTSSNNVSTEPILISAEAKPGEKYSLEHEGESGYRYTRGYTLTYKYQTPDGIKKVYTFVHEYDRNAISIFRYFDGSEELTAEYLQKDYFSKLKEKLKDCEYYARRAAKKYNYLNDIFFDL